MIVLYGEIAYTVCHNVLRSPNFTRTWPISFHATADEYYYVVDSCLVLFFIPFLHSALKLMVMSFFTVRKE